MWIYLLCAGAASLNLNGIDYDADRHFIVHGGKGMRLSIEAGRFLNTIYYSIEPPYQEERI